MSAALDLNRIAYGRVVAQYDPRVGQLRIAHCAQSAIRCKFTAVDGTLSTPDEPITQVCAALSAG